MPNPVVRSSGRGPSHCPSEALLCLNFLTAPSSLSPSPACSLLLHFFLHQKLSSHLWHLSFSSALTSSFQMISLISSALTPWPKPLPTLTWMLQEPAPNCSPSDSSKVHVQSCYPPLRVLQWIPISPQVCYKCRSWLTRPTWTAHHHHLPPPRFVPITRTTCNL